MISRFVTICIFVCLFAPSAHGATDDFTIRLSINADVTPPSTPTVLLATPIAQTQIDLSWEASTDDVLLSGYQIFRDAVQIATTTLTTYSDSGLSASTTYTYFVTAFDSVFNISSSSNSVSTTTYPATPTTTPVTGGDHDANTDIELVSFEVIPDVVTAQVFWQTDRYAQYAFRWGRTSSYELGFVTNELYKREHSTLITGLEPGTTYEYELLAFNRDGKQFNLIQGQFATKDQPDTVAPANVSNLTAVAHGENIELSWTNPEVSDFSHVRVVRSHLFYPSDVYDGFIAYQGEGEDFTDARTAKDRTVYYTVFSYDVLGNISSGAVVAVVVGEISRDTSPVLTPTESIDLAFLDIEVIQDDQAITTEQIDADLPFLLRIAYDKLPEHLKTITVTLSHPDDPSREFSFLLRINNDKTYYEAYIAPLREPGVYRALVSVYDYQTQKLFEVQGTYHVNKKFNIQNDLYEPAALFVNSFMVALIGLCAALLFVLLILLRRKKRE